VSYVCRVVGPAGRVEFLAGPDGKPKEYESPKAAWDDLELATIKDPTFIINRYCDVVDMESGESAHED
jgi:hypothetical protein